MKKASLAVALMAAMFLVAPSAGHAEGLMAEIKQKGEMTVATEAQFPPFEFVKDGEITGYGKDILDEIAAGFGVKVKQLDLPFQGLMPGLAAKKFDFIAGSMGYNKERAEKYAFTAPVAVFETGILARADDASIDGPESLSGKIVGTQMGSALEPALAEIDKYLESKGLPKMASTQLFVSFPEGHLALKGGRIDALLDATPSIGALLLSRPGEYKLAGTFGEGSYIGWLTRKEDTDVLAALNEQIARLRDSGKLKELQMKWLGFEMKLPNEMPPLN